MALSKLLIALTVVTISTLSLLGCSQALPEPSVVINTEPSTPATTATPTPAALEDETDEGVTCILNGGEVVENGWSGKDTGTNYCNQCMCSNGGLACTEMACSPMEVPDSSTTTPTATSTPTPAKFTITSLLCDDEQGPNCTKLRLGDDYLTLSTPAKGYLYSCTDKNPNAPGSRESKITWINWADNTWDFLKKLWLPQGGFDPGEGTYTEAIDNNSRQITINGLPVDGKIGDWPMTGYPTLTAIDGNPGVPESRSTSFTYPATPSKASSPTCVSLGAIGVTKNGVAIYNAVDGRGEDAVAREIVDVFGGHPAMTDYHYHFIPERLDTEFLSDGHSGIVGYINDGFPLYGYKGEGGIEMSNDDLDLCHGHDHGSLDYHYHATLEYPYTVGCYKGANADNSSVQKQPPRPPQR